MPTALEVGLMPGFALQDGDVIAKLLGGARGGGSFGLGSNVDGDGDISDGSNASADGAYKIFSSVTIITVVSPTGNSVMLAEIPVLGVLRIYNNTSEVVYVFPPPGQSIDDAPQSEAVWLSGGARCDYLYLGQGKWITDLLGTKSA